MVFKIVITNLSSIEIEDAFEYYEIKSKGLGYRFLVYLKGYIKVLKVTPELFAIKRPPFFRELPLKKFPFVIIYEINQNQVIV
ncbi:MAG: hypothetical protein ACOYBS_07730 [Flavobacterium sp.]